MISRRNLLAGAASLGVSAGALAEDASLDPQPSKRVKSPKDGPTDATKLSDTEIIAKADHFFNTTRFMSADFVQIGPDERRSEGLLVLLRPGRMLFRYKPPQQMEIVADGRSLAVRDQKLATQDLYLIGQTPLKFLLSDHMDLANDTKVRRVEMDGRAATIEIEDKATLGGKSDITLVFDPDTFELKQWTVIDPQGFRTWFRFPRSILSPSRTPRGSISTIARSPIFNPIFTRRAERGAAPALIHNDKVTRRTAHRSVVCMGRARCDPIDVAATLARLNAGAPRPTVYRAYAETAARPYSRASWEALLRLGKASLAEPANGRRGANTGDGTPIMSDAMADAESDAFWEGRLKVKPSVVTTEADNASLSVRGGSLDIRDGARRLRYDPGSRMPSAIVMAGWGGVVSIEAMRFCTSHGIAIIILDWMRELMTVTPLRSSLSAAMLRAQASAEPLPIAARIVQAKIANAAQTGALSVSDAARFVKAATNARSVQEAMIVEAQAARLAWPSPPVFQWRVGSPRIPQQWKAPPLDHERTVRPERSDMRRIRSTHA